MSDEDLKTCPFCGGDDLGVDVDRSAMTHYRNKWWNVFCLDCGTRGPIADTRDKALQYWNEREENEE